MTEATLELAGLRVTAVGDRDAARAVIVLSHGFSMEPADLAPFAHSLGLPAWFLFPEAPLAAPPRGRAWWHIDRMARGFALARGPRDFAVAHPPDLPAARARLSALFDEASALAGPRPLIAGGFSQGGMLTCDTLLRAPRPLAGVALLSASRLAFDEWRPHLAAGAVRGLPALIAHGHADPDLAFAAGLALRDALTDAGAAVTWVPFDGGHEIPLVVWRHLRKFIERVASLRPAP